MPNRSATHIDSFWSARLKWHYAILTGYDIHVYVLQNNSIELFITPSQKSILQAVSLKYKQRLPTCPCIPQLQSLVKEVMNTIIEKNCKGNLWRSSVINGNGNCALAATLTVLPLQKDSFSNGCSAWDTVCLIYSATWSSVSQQHGGAPPPL